MSTICGIIFDLDGTLINSIETFIMAFNETMDTFGLPAVSSMKLSGLVNGTRRVKEVLLELAPHVFSREDAMMHSLTRIRETYLRLEETHVQLMPGVKETLPVLKERGYRMGIVTARHTTGEAKWRELRRLGIDSFIEAIVTAAETPPKPAPDGIRKCLELLGAAEDRSYFIGDTEVDIIAGHRAGVRVIALASPTYDRAALTAHRPWALIDSLHQLVETISPVTEETQP